MSKGTNRKFNRTFVEKISCRCYADPIVDPPVTYNSEGNGYIVAIACD